MWLDSPIHNILVMAGHFEGGRPKLGMGKFGRHATTDLPNMRAPLGVAVIEVVAGEAEALP